MARQLSADKADRAPSTDDPRPVPSAAIDARTQAMRTRALRAVLRLLEAKGYENIQLGQVAEEAHMSLATIYKYFFSRDELLVAAVEVWMDENVYQFKMPRNESTFEALIRVFRTIYEPWAKHPRMLDAFVRAAATTCGSRLIGQGQIAVAPVIRKILGDLDPAFVDDVEMIMIHVNSSIYTSVASGQMNITDAVPTFERTLSRLLPTEPKISKRSAQPRSTRQDRVSSKATRP
jgi:TetR/AcrR family transcriptional regulator, cholesterol catabolism regulator